MEANFCNILGTKKVFETYCTKRNLVRYQTFIKIYFVNINWAFRIVKFMFLHLSITKWIIYEKMNFSHLEMIHIFHLNQNFRISVWLYLYLHSKIDFLITSFHSNRCNFIKACNFFASVLDRIEIYMFQK